MFSLMHIGVVTTLVTRSNVKQNFPPNISMMGGSTSPCSQFDLVDGCLLHASSLRYASYALRMGNALRMAVGMKMSVFATVGEHEGKNVVGTHGSNPHGGALVACLVTTAQCLYSTIGSYLQSIPHVLSNKKRGLSWK